MTSQHWDFMCSYAHRTGNLTAFAEGLQPVTARTADPRLNPRAVAPSESSTRFRKAVETRMTAARRVV